MSEPAYRVGVKYCGGCNSRYDRTALVRRLEGEFPALDFAPALPGPAQDLLLVVCGCGVRCAGASGLEGRLGSLTIWSERGLPAARAFLQGAYDSE